MGADSMNDSNSSVGRGSALILATIVLGMFLDGLDGTIVNVALPEIASDFQIDSSTSSWIVTIYFLVLAGLVLVFGKLCDSGAIKKIVLAGFAIFTFGSLACGLSFNIGVLLAFRAIQGIGASMLAASCIMLSVKFLPPGKVGFGLALGLLGSSIGAAVGPALGGVLAATISWHWIFFINLPIGIIALFIARKGIPADTGFDRSAFDYKGSAILFLALVCGLYTLESFPSHGVTTVTVVALILFVILFAAFLIYERRISYPVLKLHLFKSRRFDALCISFLLVNACYMGCLYLLPFYMRVELGYDTIMCGLFLLIMALVTLVFCLKSSKMAETRGNRPLVLAGCVVLVIAMIVLSSINAGLSIWFLVLGLALMGLVWGICGGPIGARLIDNVPPEDKGSGSSLLSFFIYFGNAVGTALFSGLFGFGSNASGQPIADLDPAIFMNGFSFAMTVGVVLAVIALITAWVVNENKRKAAEGSSRV